MRTPHSVPIKDSIATHLMVVVFAIYVLITVALTGVHMYAEYRNTRDDVQRRLVSMGRTFGPGLATAIYNVDQEQVRSMLLGMVQDPAVEGVLVQTEFQGDFSAGEMPAADAPDFTEQGDPDFTPRISGLTARMPIIFIEGRERFAIGLLTLRSAPRVVLERLWFSMIFIAVNSVIKAAALWVIFLWVSRRHLSRPLTALTRAAADVDLDTLEKHRVEVETPGRNELRVLADAFNEMIEKLLASRQGADQLRDRLQQAKDQLEDYSRTLESKVAERTDELDRKNADLEETVEQLRVAKEQAEESTRFKSAFLANMSHEIRTPMNTVLGMADLLRESDLDDDQRRFLDILAGSGQNLLQLINDILDLSKVESGQLRLEHRQFEMTDLADGVCKAATAQVREKGLEMICRVDPKLPARFAGDPTRLRQVFSNLVSNAVKFTAEGEVELFVERDPESDMPGALRMGVRDTGIGIPERMRESIFESFVQADSSTSRKFGGTGLGLAICRELVQLMGGEIEALRGPERGSLFLIRLRLEVPPPPAVAVSPDLSGARLLLAEGNRTLRAAAAERLAAWGARVREVADGRAALAVLEAAARKGRPLDMVLLSDNLNGLSPLQILEECRGREVGPVVLVRGGPGGVPQERLAGLGVVLTLNKPLGCADLHQAALLLSRRS